MIFYVHFGFEGCGLLTSHETLNSEAPSTMARVNKSSVSKVGELRRILYAHWSREI
jgi:hypothetical protein